MNFGIQKKVLILVAPGFEEIETIATVDILRRSGAKVILAGIQKGNIEGSRGVITVPDCELNEISNTEFDMLILPGGLPGVTNLSNDSRVIRLINQMYHHKKLIAAICAAPIILQKSGILQGKAVTSHPSVAKDLKGVIYKEGRVVVDNNIITSRSPGTALEFSFKLVEILFGSKRVDIVNKGVMARI